MQSTRGLKPPRDRQRSAPNQSTSGYYQFTFEEDFSDDSVDFQDALDSDLSPKDRVARILQETELGPMTLDDSLTPEPDFRLELSDDDAGSVEDDRVSPPSTLNIKRYSDVQDEGRPETPESLHSPLDDPDTGFIDFITERPKSSSERSPSEGFEDDFNIDNSNSSIDQNDRKSLPAVRFTRFRSVLPEETVYIDDELSMSHGPEACLPMDVELRDLSETSGTKARPSKRDDGFLPMSSEISIDDDDVMVSSQGVLPEEDDRHPIIFMDQTSLAELHRRRRKRIMIAIGVVAVIFGLAGLAAISYLLVKFLMNID